MSFGVFYALYMCLVIEIWIIINNCMLFIFLMGKGKIVVYCCYSFISGFVTCRRLSVHGVTLPMLSYCRCEFFSLGALFFLCGFAFSSPSIGVAMSSAEGLPLPVHVGEDDRSSWTSCVSLHKSA